MASREVADRRVHGTTAEAPAARFAREPATRPLGGRVSFGQLRDLTRQVQADCAVDVDTHSYSARWRPIGEAVLMRSASGGW